MSSMTDLIREVEPSLNRGAARAAQPSSGDVSAHEQAHAAAVAANESLDAETRELVVKFEELYSELAPPPATPADEAIQVDDLLFELPEDPTKLLSQPTTTKPTAVQRKTAPRAGAPAAVHAIKPRRVEEDTEVSFDEAMTLLRAAEAQGKVSAQRAALDLDEERSGDEAFASTPAEELPQQRARALGRMEMPAPAGVDEESWSSRSHSLVSKVMGAAAVALVALVVGTGIGYVVARPSASAAPAKIGITPQGGAQLRFDYDLAKP